LLLCEGCPFPGLLNTRSSKLNLPPKPFGSRHLSNEIHSKVFSG
jgi:hypothetical protein